MPLLTSLLSSADALRVIERSLQVSQNNVANASTPGYAAQRQGLEALPFDPSQGVLGGVQAGPLLDSRSQFAEQAVRRQQEALGEFSQKAGSLTAVEGTLDISSAYGIPGALGQLFQSFSAWSLTPTSGAARQAVIDAAQNTALSFHNASAGLEKVSSDTELDVRQTVDHINALSTKLEQYNVERQHLSSSDPSLDAKVQSTLEELSGLANFTTIGAADGTITVLLGGQTPLVIGDHQYKISANFALPTNPPPVNPLAPPGATILDTTGQDITSQVTSGSLGALLDVRNRLLPSLRGDGNQPGELNRLASAVADRVNQILTSGWISDGPPPQPGVPLFTYDATDPTRAAATLALDPGITADNLAAIDPGPPYVSNGVALAAASLANPQSSADELDGVSYVSFYGNLAAGVGQELSTASDRKDLQTGLVAQAQGIRQDLSGVSLDAEAVLLIQFQRAYQANAKMVNILDQLTQTTIDLLQ
jgi:flagellar hook-associated protein 1 FlgK